MQISELAKKTKLSEELVLKTLGYQYALNYIYTDKDTETISLCLDEKTYKKLQAAAKKLKVDISALVVALLDQHLKDMK